MNRTVSLCMIVKNEEKNLSRCLESVKDLVDEIIIVDTGSEDRTVEIAKQYGAQVISYQWKNDFSAARNESLRHAKGYWILLMDADDEFCKEDQDKFKDIVESGEQEVYFFETHSYVGERPGPNITVNMNLRLLKNHAGYYFQSPIHEQLMNHKFKEDGNKKMQVGIKNIRIYHYGYLQSSIEEKQKRTRNIGIIQKQLQDEPNNPFHYFNLGSEFFADHEYEEALENFLKIYEHFDPNTGYSSKMIVRMVLCYYFLERFDEGIEFANKMLKYYPKLTDLEYLKGMIYHKQKRYSLAIDSFHKSIDMGDPPSNLKFIHGVADYRIYNALCDLYMELKDYEKVLKYSIKLIQIKPDYVIPLYNIVHILKIQNISIEEIKRQIEGFFDNLPEQLPLIADLFYMEKYYGTALEYLLQYEEIYGQLPSYLLLFKCKCLLNMGRYEKCSTMILDYEEQYPSSLKLVEIQLFCRILLKEHKKVYEYLEHVSKRRKFSEEEQKRLEVYHQFANIIFENPKKELSNDSKETQYTSIIFEVLDLLLNNHEYDVFEKALELLNLISDETVLLNLGKLYERHGFHELAKKEIIRSIKEFEMIDKEGLEILLMFI